MNVSRIIPLVLLVPAVALAQSPPPVHQHYEKPPEATAPVDPGKPLAPRLQNLGVHRFPVSTKVSRAQLFMNQGVNLSYGFNHAEAGRAFAEAARLDPNLAMAYWGQALVLGPNINALMEPNEEPQAYELVQKAIALKSRATSREQAYIEALAQRSRRPPGTADDRCLARPARTSCGRARPCRSATW